MGEIKSAKSCLVCLNSSENIKFVPTEESQKILNVCCSYVKDSINIEFLVKNISANNELSFCKNCLNSSLILTQLVDQLSTLKKEITDFTNNFSETISKRRCQAITNIIKQQNFINTPKTDFIVSNANSQLHFEACSSEKEILEEPNNSETSDNHLLINPSLSQIEISKNQNLKYEIYYAVSTENEADLSTNWFCDAVENTNGIQNDFINIVEENATFDLQENIAASEIITCESEVTIKSNKPIARSTNSALVVNFDKVPKIILERIREQVKNVNASPTSLTSSKDKPNKVISIQNHTNSIISGNARKPIRRNQKMKTKHSTVHKNHTKKYRKLTNTKHPFPSSSVSEPMPVAENVSEINFAASDRNNDNSGMESDNEQQIDTQIGEQFEQTELKRNVHEFLLANKNSSRDFGEQENVSFLDKELSSVKSIESVVHGSKMRKLKAKDIPKPVRKKQDPSKIYVIENGQLVTFYQCKACEEKFQSRALYRKHRQVCDCELAKGPYRCGFCDRSWTKLANRSSHWRINPKCGDLHRIAEELRQGQSITEMI